MSGISLTASMRSNLLSLQNISGQVSSTQNKLSTGNKVNSAIDNPSSYYTALSLNNRADDLNALLDSMGQAVSTIKAATTALESATEFLEQAKAVANQALEIAKVPDKAFFEEKVGENGAVVTTAQELKDAVAAGKETICVYGAIDLGDISTSGGLTLQENQKLVGVGYFGNYDTDTNKFSSITATANVANKYMILVSKNNTTISDLSVDYTNTSTSGGACMRISGAGGVTTNKTTLRNLDMISNGVATNSTASILSSMGIINIEGALNIQNFTKDNVIDLRNGTICNIGSDAHVNIDAKGEGSRGFYLYSQVTLNIESNAKINIKTQGGHGCGFDVQVTSCLDVASEARINIETLGSNADGIRQGQNSVCNFAQDSELNITTFGASGNGLFISEASTFSFSGIAKISTQNGHCVALLYNYGNKFNVTSSAQIYLHSASTRVEIRNCYHDGSGANVVDITTGAKLAFEKNGKTDWYEVKEKYHDENTSATTDNTITADNVKDVLNVEETSAWELPEKVEIDFEDGNSNGETAKQDLADAGKNYQEIINQYDSLIKDASYKGINLLQADKLTVKFNETNTADLSVQGKDMSSQALGFTVFGWETQGDIADSLAEIASALQSIRNYSSELGNNYSIITTRQDFTESLINVLTEGADKLTLADMNEESANMLALQTRQQLAINSLSLASQASQSILKLF